MTEDGAFTTDRLLGGRVVIRQPRKGFRSALDPVLLAAAVPAVEGERVLEGGVGSGAALLCLSARVGRVFGLGVDRDPEAVSLARGNAALNGFPTLLFAAADLGQSPIAGTFDHAFANPPYHPEEGTRSFNQRLDESKREVAGMLDGWARSLAAPLRHRGTLTFILPPRQLESALVAFRQAGAAAERVAPIWSKGDRPARWIILTGRKGGRAQLTMREPLVLHDESGAYRPDAAAILRDALPLCVT